MDSLQNSTVHDLVERFVAERRAGRRTAIDALAGELPPAADRMATCTAAAEVLARQLRASIGEGGAPPALDDLRDVPHIEGYDIIDLIGRGGMGVVYEAYQRSTGRRVAIKVMAGGGEAIRRRFEREVDLVARLNHPGIVSLLDSGVHRGQYYFVMEYVEGVPLDQALPPGAADPRRCAELLAAVCDAVDYAHQRGVLHRDLKPSNVLVVEGAEGLRGREAEGGSRDARGPAGPSATLDPSAPRPLGPLSPKVLDFGLAKAVDPRSGGWQDMTLSEPGQLLGTLGYMAPEQARGDASQTSVRSDVYSLGAILYELLAGRLPCPVEGPLGEVLQRIATHDPPSLSRLGRRIPRDIDAIALKALSKAPPQRYATAADLAADLRRCLADQPVLARPIGWPTRLARWVRRNRAVSLVGGLAAVVLLVGGVFSAVRITRERANALANEQLAREKLKFALEALDKLVFDTDRMLGDVLGTAQVRRSLLDVAIRFYDALPQDAALLGLESLTGPQYGRLGDALHEREDSERARRYYAISLDSARVAAAARPDAADAQRELAVALQRCAAVAADPEQAARLMVESLAILRRLADGAAPDAPIHVDLADGVMRSAEFESRLGHRDGALSAARQALDLQAAVARAAPETDAAPALGLLALHGRAGDVAQALADHDAVRAGCLSAIECADALAAQWPSDAGVQLECCRAKIRAAGRLSTTGAAERATSVLDEARRRAEELVEREPRDLRMRLVAAASCSYLGNAARARGAPQEAIRWYERCNAVVTPAFELQPDNASYRERFAVNLASLGGAYVEVGDWPAAVKVYGDFLTASEPLFAEQVEHAPLRAYAWRVLGDQAAAADPGRAAECYRRGLADLERLAGRRALSGYEARLRSELATALDGVAEPPEQPGS